MRKIIVLITFMMLVSCGKSTYYAFEEYDRYSVSNSPNLYSYCTLEITPKKEAIFRGFSGRYLSRKKEGGHYDITDYIHIYSNKKATRIAKYGISFCQNSSECKFLLRDNQEKEYNDFKVTKINDLRLRSESILYTYRNKKKDTIFALDDDMMKNFIKSDKGFNDANIPWFPPYLVKIKKIDYNKFIEKRPKLMYTDFMGHK